jgi:predicted translin family RNA/ssDNA-binding protein
MHTDFKTVLHETHGNQDEMKHISRTVGRLSAAAISRLFQDEDKTLQSHAPTQIAWLFASKWPDPVPL